MALPATAQRVAQNTSERYNQRISDEIYRSLTHYMTYEEGIPERLQELDVEWDIERVLETNAATLTLIGLGLGLGVDRRFLAIPVTVNAFLLQHALQGWCPPLPLLRRLGFRTQSEIEAERYGLLAIQQHL